jgi:hypothetical protein
MVKEIPSGLFPFNEPKKNCHGVRAKASRDKLAISGMEKIEAYDQMEKIADLAMPVDENRIVTFERNRWKSSEISTPALTTASHAEMADRALQSAIVIRTRSVSTSAVGIRCAPRTCTRRSSGRRNRRGRCA